MHHQKKKLTGSLVAPEKGTDCDAFFHYGKEKLMFRWGIIFLVIALIAAALGFGSLAGTAAWAAKIVFVVGIILFLVSLFTGRRRP
ncbi:Small integral membrane protein [Serratia quinivorans]|jgi:uncharacterized membrane protein YtjA (UPF0391 family)|uniref:UPF0391 membrane protein NCTC11544_01691 n=17 Tax=Bacteria TaxID=2 RepID=A0A379Z4F0_9GAMM|nr:Small integral membrane protein [Serratia quinivorans]CAI0986079.1 Small integral membrane protein [Serratia quinivorans]CAI1038598.1 Small integral membrane protein [Serratia quinivorans]CAI1056447.1 Small integral membrane protein [Serratia quinivorans]CAI1092358.1 Small integral membrane protein [Serratia quinivorans]